MKYELTVPYIGGILSDNSYRFKKGGKKPYVKWWMRDLEEAVRKLEILKAEKFRIGVFARYWDERRPDTSNLFKVIADSVKEGLGVDDKFFIMVDEGYEVGHLNPELVITIERVE